MIYWLIFIALEIGRNYYMIERLKTKPHYLQSFILRGWAHILVCIFVYGITVPSEWPSFREILALDYFKILGFHVSSFWLIFDPVLNVLRDKPWNYRGKTSGWLDRIPSQLIYWLMKLAALTYVIQWIFFHKGF